MSLILVVDDSLFDLKRASALLQKQLPESTILTARDGQEALDIIEDQQPQIVVTDLQMPNVNGLDLVVQTQERFPLIPVVLMTAAGSEEIAAEALRKGAASYVPKSQLAGDLGPVVARLLGSAREKDHQRRLLECLTTAKFVMENDRNLHTAFVHELRDVLESRGLFTENECFRITTAIDEALSNAFYHGNLEVSSELREEDIGLFEKEAHLRLSQEPYRSRQVTIEIDFSNGLEITITDQGPGFDPGNLPDPFEEGFADKPSGRGVLLMRSFMDDVRFNERGNEVTLVKNSEAMVSVPT